MKSENRMAKKRITVINGSLRDDGNTDVLVRKFIKSAEDAGCLVDYHVLRRMNINNCIGCYKCNETDECNFDDEMTVIRNSIEKSEILLLASPLYWCEVTGLMKTFIDRLYYYHHSGNSQKIRGEEALIITTLGENDNIDYETEVIREFYRRLLHSLGIELLEHAVFPDIMGAGEVLTKGDYLSKAYDMGKNI